MKAKLLRLLAVNLAVWHFAATVPLCAQTCTNPPSGLVGWWSGDGHFFDLAGTNQGTAGAGVSFVPGKVGRAFRFVDAADSWIQLPNSPEFQPSNNQLTIEAWVKPDFNVTGSKLDTLFMKRDGCGSPYSYNFAITKGFPGYPMGAFGLGMLPQISFIYGTNRIPDDGQFHHIAATYNGNKPSGNCVLYLDGQIAGGGDGPGAIPVTSTGPVMGKHAECGYYSSMDLDELGFYNRELSAGEIQAIYAAGSAGKCKPSFPVPAGLVSWWPAEGNFSDLVGTNHGTPVGGVSFAPGEVGLAFAFATTNDWIRLPRNPAIFALTVGTVEFWVKILSLEVDTVRLFSVAEAGVAYPDAETWAIEYRHGGAVYGAIQVYLVAGGSIAMNAFTPAGTITDTNWHHVAVVADGVDPIQIYVDGAAQVLTGVFASPVDRFLGHAPNASVMAIGAVVREAVYAEGVKMIDEVAVYDRALTPGEVAAIYAAGSAGKALPPALAASLVSNGVLLSWPASAISFGLVSCPDLTAGSWEAVTNEPAINGAWKEVLLPTATPAQRFFRLQLIGNQTQQAPHELEP